MADFIDVLPDQVEGVGDDLCDYFNCCGSLGSGRPIVRRLRPPRHHVAQRRVGKDDIGRNDVGQVESTDDRRYYLVDERKGKTALSGAAHPQASAGRIITAAVSNR